jgi:hypothetical protein
MDRSRADLDQFVAEIADELLLTAYLIVWDLPEAGDLIRQALLKIAGRWSRVRRVELPIGYAGRISVNLAHSAVARRSRRRAQLSGQGVPDRSDQGSEWAGSTHRISRCGWWLELLEMSRLAPGQPRGGSTQGGRSARTTFKAADPAGPTGQPIPSRCSPGDNHVLCQVSRGPARVRSVDV